MNYLLICFLIVFDLSWKYQCHVGKMLEILVNVDKYYQQPQNIEQISLEWEWVSWHCLWIECMSKSHFVFLVHFRADCLKRSTAHTQKLKKHSQTTVFVHSSFFPFVQHVTNLVDILFCVSPSINTTLTDISN